MDRRHDHRQHQTARAMPPRARRGLRSGEARGGQSTLEFALVAPIFIVLVLSIYTFGLLFEAKISLDNAVRDGARYASQYATKWDTTSTSPAPNTIEGRVINSGGIASIANSNITLTYYTVSTSSTPYTTTTCGTVSASSTTTSTCAAKGNMVAVTAKINYQIPLPVVSNIIRLISKSGVPMQSTAAMMIEQ